VTARHRVSPADAFWDVARALRAAHVASLARNEHWLTSIPPCRLAALFGRVLGRRRAAAYARLLERLHPSGLVLTNLGRLSFPARYGALEIESLGGMVNPSVFNYAGAIAATINDRLSWNFLGCAPLVSRGRLAGLAQQAVEELCRAAGDTRAP
jgi:hypothetical protein